MSIDTKTGEIFETADQAEDDPHMIAKINGIVPKIVFPFVAKNDIRFYLNGINIRQLDENTGGVMICASDGHRLIVVRDPDGWVEEELTVAIHKDGLKHASADGEFVVMSNGSAWWQSSTALPLFIQPGNSRIDGKFPRFEAILHQIHGFEEGIHGAVNPDFLRDALAIDTGSAMPSIRFWTKRDDMSPLIFKVDQVAGLEAVGAVMKLRESSDRLPTWIPAPEPFELTRELEPMKRAAEKADKPLNTVGNGEARG